MVESIQSHVVSVSVSMATKNALFYYGVNWFFFVWSRAVEDRKLSVIKAIGYKLTPEIQYSIEYARTLQDIEEIVSPCNVTRYMNLQPNVTCFNIT